MRWMDRFGEWGEVNEKMDVWMDRWMDKWLPGDMERRVGFGWTDDPLTKCFTLKSRK